MRRFATLALAACLGTLIGQVPAAHAQKTLSIGMASFAFPSAVASIQTGWWPPLISNFGEVATLDTSNWVNRLRSKTKSPWKTGDLAMRKPEGLWEELVQQSKRIRALPDLPLLPDVGIALR